MNFLGLGPGEILLVMLLALIVFGPGKLPEIGQGLGRAIRQFRAATSEITEEFNRELNIEKMLQDPPKQPAPAPAEPLSRAAATIAATEEAASTGGVLDQPEPSEIPAPGRPVITVAGDEETAQAQTAAEPATPAVESAEPVALSPLATEYPYGELVSRTDATPEVPVTPAEDSPETAPEPKTTEGTGV